MSSTIFNLDANAAPAAVTAADTFQVNKEHIIAAYALGYMLMQAVNLPVSSAENTRRGNQIVAGSEGDYIANHDLFGGLIYDDDGRPEALKSPVLQALIKVAIDNVKEWASDVHRFYNKEKLAKLVTDQMVMAFEIGAHELADPRINLETFCEAFDETFRWNAMNGEVIEA